MIRTGLLALAPRAPGHVAAFDITRTWARDETFANGINQGQMTGTGPFFSDERNQRAAHLAFSGGEGQSVEAMVSPRTRWEVIGGRLSDKPAEVRSPTTGSIVKAPSRVRKPADCVRP